MPLILRTIPCLTDNYAFLLHDDASGATAVIDVPDAAPIEAALKAEGWTLSHIWITHHHDDHIQGVDTLRAATGAKVTGASADAHRLPALDTSVTDGDSFQFAGADVQVMDVSGHTLGHIAFYVSDAGAVFTADSLMAMGCGRLFEGDAQTMWTSLQKLAALPPDTLVCSGHEYTTANVRFALSVDPNNAALKDRAIQIADARADDHPTVPSVLADERATNPFLRCADPDMAEGLGMGGADPAQVFAEVRARKDRF